MKCWGQNVLHISFIATNYLTLWRFERRGVIPTHLSPVVLKHHEAGLRVSSAGAGGGGAASRPTPRTPRVQPTQPAHIGPNNWQVKGHKSSMMKEGVPVKRSEYRQNRSSGKLEGEEKEKILGEGGWGGGEEEKGRRGRESSVRTEKVGKGGQLLSLPVSVSVKAPAASESVWPCPPCRPCHPVWSQHHSIASLFGLLALCKKTTQQISTH